jgi:lipoprotein-anchoring transpeptidase ErfK/SrfK
MKRFFLLLAAVAAVSVPLGGAVAASRYGPRPPVVLSPDLTAPWVMQLRVKPTAGPATPERTTMTPAGGPPTAILRGEAPLSGRSLQYYPPAPAAAGQRQSATQTPRAVREAALMRPSKKAIAPGIDPKYLPQEVAYDGPQKPGTIIIDTNKRFLYYVEKGGKAERYGVGVGRPGFEWAGTHKITRKAEWPEWRPPQEMLAREKAKGRILPVMMPGGPANPLGARALYIGSTLYRIHGTNQPWTIGRAVSSGCIRMRNKDVISLYGRVKVGTKVVVM